MIRYAVPADVKAILNLHARAWPAAYQNYVSPDVIERVTSMTAEKENKILTQIKAGDVLVVEQDQNIVGYALVNRDSDELKQLYVDPDLKRHGIGTLLFQAVQKDLKARGVNQMVVWTMKDYPVSNAFYRKQGGILTDRQMRLKINIDTVMYLFQLKGKTKCR